MQSPQDSNPTPPPVYSMPPPSFSFPRWAKIFVGCGVLLLILLFLGGIGINRVFKSRRGAIQTELCFQNLRSAQRGLALYSQDYDQTLPPSTAWMDAATPYVKQRTDFKCPVVRLANPTGFGYAFNSALSKFKTAGITSPETTAEVYDSADLQRNASDALTSLPSPPRHLLERTRAQRNAPKNGNLILYADGHVRFAAADGTSVDISNMNMRRTLFAPRPKTK